MDQVGDTLRLVIFTMTMIGYVFWFSTIAKVSLDALGELVVGYYLSLIIRSVAIVLLDDGNVVVVVDIIIVLIVMRVNWEHLVRESGMPYGAKFIVFRLLDLAE